ncbi:hypothetical protein CPAST_c33740 [Clostridium pasteurianum DSM 525 = ATCC 6013]|uniref:Uncharacterized protein n=1 Tax=Clostridium pasteurianum DSM 525 = ATCC 6013 TaxID=1262449 RepID=A0A0H3JBB5_CLOPA|nr:hypothetical protein [Clostridium pasteurianum]AJA49440.1 hypothetical protein CPAST_c33740 [Clostridium pasteurianum DSM 525 = ATCC 6013]AJA53428.1 hypothetical protein CLPA_c33740 [Clostridium pasteurianum DSM 525 = ATCC 6013]AOZ76607.1 hypothetical protein AQ983_16395 [Clostridium pasteurianum DSM 525 = ATCC 6013]AOZ80404.1 hypothetical protein AQ984_16390 [Clostridium pasteurianum]ELP58444.1 hypothetical protein F502_14500 [Clostridium pasteurianum DSM 525 = ATCC 6013]
MKKRFFRVFIFITAFILITLSTIGLGYYKKATALEQSSNFKIEVSNKSDNKNISKTTIVDIAQQGLPKQLIQPNVQSIKGTIVNKDREDISLQLQYKDFDGKISINSKMDKSFGVNGNLNTVLKATEEFNITVLLNIPRNVTNRHLVTEGIINIINLKNNSIIGTIPIKIINSNTADKH